MILDILGRQCRRDGVPSSVSVPVLGGGRNWCEDLVQPKRPLEDMQARKQAKLNQSLGYKFDQIGWETS